LCVDWNFMMAATTGMVIANENKLLFKETINVIEL
jgi:hypothetical protein